MSAARRAAAGLAVALLAGLLLLLAHQHIRPDRLEVWIDSGVRSSLSLEVRCQAAGEVFTHREAIQPRYQRLRLPLPACRLDMLTLDSDAADARVAAVLISRYGVPREQLLGEKQALVGEGFLRMDPRPDLARAVALDAPLTLQAGGLDAGAPVASALELVVVPVLIWLAALVMPRRDPARREPPFTRGWGLVMLLAVATMAWIVRTDVSLSPDEGTHVTTAHYHFDHWVKPAIGSPELEPAYRASRYGISYLSSTDPVYLIAAKFAVAAWPLLQDDVLGLRLFNVLLLVWLVVAAARLRRGFMLLLPLLLMPQAWYLFAYFNGDALPYALSTMLFLLALSRWTTDESARPPTVAWAVAFGGLTGLLLLSKQNYWPCLLLLVMLWISACRPGLGERRLQWLGIAALGFVFAFPVMLDTTLPLILRVLPGALLLLVMLVLLATWLRRQWQARRAWMPRWRVAGWVALGLCGVIGLKMVDELANNAPPWAPERAAAALAVQEKFAAKTMRPSAFASGAVTDWYRMRSQGKGLSELHRRGWLNMSVRSAFGSYGFMDIWSPIPLSIAMLASLLAVLAAAGLRAEPLPAVPGVRMAVLVGCASVFVASALFSWTGDYQPQGRYLLGFVPMLGLGLAIVGRYERPALQVAAKIGFLLALVSFVGYGIAGLVAIAY